MDSKNIIIAVLTVTAVVLLCTLVLVYKASQFSGSSPAWADTVDRGGDYILATGGFSASNEALYTLDGFNDMLRVYQYDSSQKRIVSYDSVDLRDYFVFR